MITDFWDGGALYCPQLINGKQVERVDNSIFLGTIIFDTSKYQPYNQQDALYAQILQPPWTASPSQRQYGMITQLPMIGNSLNSSTQHHTASEAWAVIFYLWPPSTPHKISHKREKVEVLRLPDTITSTITNNHNLPQVRVMGVARVGMLIDSYHKVKMLSLKIILVLGINDYATMLLQLFILCFSQQKNFVLIYFLSKIDFFKRCKKKIYLLLV